MEAQGCDAIARLLPGYVPKARYEKTKVRSGQWLQLSNDALAAWKLTKDDGRWWADRYKYLPQKLVNSNDPLEEIDDTSNWDEVSPSGGFPTLKAATAFALRHA